MAPKSRFRFGFNGKRKRDIPPERVSSDEILDSLTRQAGSQITLGKDQTQRLDFLMEDEEPTISADPVVSTVSRIKHHSDRKSFHYVTALVCIAGIIAVWLYSSGKNILPPSSWTSLVHVTTVSSVFASPVQIAIISVIAVTSAIWVAARRRASRFPFPI